MTTFTGYLGTKFSRGKIQCPIFGVNSNATAFVTKFFITFKLKQKPIVYFSSNFCWFGWQVFYIFSCECVAIKYTNMCPLLFNGKKGFTTEIEESSFSSKKKKKVWKITMLLHSFQLYSEHLLAFSEVFLYPKAQICRIRKFTLAGKIETLQRYSVHVV